LTVARKWDWLFGGCQYGRVSAWFEDVGLDTERLHVSNWHRAAERAGVDLAESVAELLTARTTESLPGPWRGDYSLERAQRWIAERDAESPTLLVTDQRTGAVVGLVLLFVGTSIEEGHDDLRIGYLLSDAVWGRGLGSELVAGLVRWAKASPGLSTVTAGVEESNAASARVLVKNGFARVGPGSDGGLVYSLDVASDPWDEYAAAWDDDPDARAYAAAAFGSLVAVLDDCGATLAGANVCDFGCGTGLLTEQFAGTAAPVDAVDTSVVMRGVPEAKAERRGWRHVRLDRNIPSAHGSHDLVVCSSVCSFLDDYPGTVQRLADLLRPGGLFVQWDWERHGEDRDPHGLSRSEVHEAIEAAGLADVHVGTAFEIEIDGYLLRPLIGVGQKPMGVDP